MSTRCNIVIKDKNNTFYVYHHCDGYPEGVGSFLYRKVNDNLKKGRFCYAEDVVNYLLKDKEDNSYELTSCIHGDIEYLYEIDCQNQTLKCFAVDWYRDSEYAGWRLNKGDEINLEERLSD